MIVRYVPVQYFVGRLYVNARSEKNCSWQGNGKEFTILHIPIGDEIRENSCGIVRAYQISNSTTTGYNRTLISTVIVIQNHPSVQSQGDRLIKVGCILNGNNGGLGMGSDRTNRVLIDREVEVKDTNTPLDSELHLKPTLKLIDLDNNIETNRVQVGQNMELRIFYKETIPYDFKVVNLKAMSDNGQEIMLVDNNGCPVDADIFPGLTQQPINGIPNLFGRFMAFKFSGSSEVKFEMTVRNCYRACPSIVCPTTTSNTRSRRSPQQQLNPVQFPTNPPPLNAVRFPNNSLVQKYTREVLNISEDDSNLETNVLYQRVISSFDEPLEMKAKKLGDDVANVEVRQVSRNYSKVIEIPMRFNIKVEPSPESIVPESLIYGENSLIMVSDLDTINDPIKNPNSVCMDQTFLLSLLLFFGLLLIILVVGCSLMIYRYKRRLQLEEDRSSLHRFQLGFDPYDSFNRRVHWADGIANRSAYP